MEIRKELPEIFEEFAEGRKNAFLSAKKQKDKNLPLVGTYCTYVPVELPMAMNAAVVGLCSMSDETIPLAERDLPASLCPLIKSSYGFAKSDKCPFFYFSDLVVAESTCDGKKKMYELMSEFKPMHIMQLPNTQDEDGFALWKKEVIRFKEKLEDFFGVEITEDQIREAIKLRNEERRAALEIFDLMKMDPTPVMGYDLFKVVYGASFTFDRELAVKQMREVKDRILEEAEENSAKIGHKPRIIISGCPMGGATEKVARIIEETGGVVVAFENCTGIKNYYNLVDEDNPDVYEALAERYFKIGCSVMSPDTYRFQLLGELIDEFKADAVVDMTLQGCHTYNIETYEVSRFVTEEKGIAYYHVETDYSNADEGQLNTRLQALIEML
ncbi:Benzoyl-CoA reductase subunit C [Slackia heliotrinireducens]|uniref:Benzoyl-CoA reductase/2-hydroxyglutaryl-CoA dehydratase subunit, BcrC/BadD/HgdB n=1 Tax=Slackia heliotrinireducens (strain ATCC 29202 / DSM 20476 / NCTC 11029 / RHS 1) TaxID=471855 RepID=C7N398_SLAHD|nr:double-cubane-cluster-containing anaerobic reductase [Slackia heliotrinireducens]ACV23621.1 Benzoyl-CoA reductase/2-hydroxyglutaryl-CoA dehydratase subunit, BcrC/BadD/HgdB [Slackia heliotrinireducens DSM 20476]VEH03108.1 Benzoyl-CoA reductase subunit C [Slackia heliotrinireducens]